MAKKKTVTKNATKKKTAKRLSEVMKPSGMTLEEWQVALRQQAAMSENFGIEPIDEESAPGEYWVRNPHRTGDTRWCIVEQIVCGTIAHVLISRLRN